jgi:hypothetical protein
MEIKFTFEPHEVSRRFILILPKRAQEILMSRYGLGDDGEKMTLEAIGRVYGITRERVRQIENHSLNTLRKSDVYKVHMPTFGELEEAIHKLGGVVSEHELLEHVARDERSKNHVVFLLELGHMFKKEREDKHLKHRWYLEKELHDRIHDALHNLYAGLSDEDLVTESELIDRFLSHLKDVSDTYRDQEIARRWLSVSKRISRNPLGEWGRATSPNVRIKGIRDYAYLVMRKHGSPMHFREVASKIREFFGKSAHVATTHNELIKDPRFILVGRGLYALREWGYATGIVKDVIKTVLSKYGPLTKEDIVERVMKERYVKPNTILVNLRHSDIFARDDSGRYYLKANAQ